MPIPMPMPMPIPSEAEWAGFVAGGASDCKMGQSPIMPKHETDRDERSFALGTLFKKRRG